MTFDVEIKEKKRNLNSPVAKALQAFAASYEKASGMRYLPSYSRDYKVLKDLITHLGETEKEPLKTLCEVIDYYFSREKHCGWSVCSLRACFNRVCTAMRNRKNIVRQEPRFDNEGNLLKGEQ